MKIKFNKFERVAGLFVLTAVVGAFALGVSVAVKRGWFETKVEYYTVFDSAEGLHPGTLVQVAGLRAGAVDSVELQSDSSVVVHFSVLARFQKRVRKDSVTRLVRPFLIGDRILEVTVGADTEALVPKGGHVAAIPTTDIMTLMSGRNLAPVLETLSGLSENLKLLGEAFLRPERTEMLIRTFDQIEPLVLNLSKMSNEVINLSEQMTTDKNLGVVIANLRHTTEELNTILPEFSKDAPRLASEVSELVANLALLTNEFKVLVPALAEIAPDLPYSSRRAVEALDEAVVLMKALQNSFLLRGNVDDIRALENKNGIRMPSQSEPAKERK